MTVRNGREFLAIPGPTTVPDDVLSAMHRPAIDIYEGTLVDTTATCLSDLRRVFGTQGRTYIYAANGHGGWEAALTNVLSRGDKVLVLASGLFAMGWGEMGAVMGVQVEVLPGSWRRAVDPDKLEQRLRKDDGGEIKAVMVVQVDTASGVVNDIPAVREAMNAAGHDALLMVDTIASLATMPFEMDAWGVDVAVAGAQKGLMMPPGLSFNAAGPKAKEVHKTADLRTRYWDWTFREGEVHYQKYCGTPPEHQLFGLRKALDMVFEEGLDEVLTRHRLLAEATRAAVAKWAEGGAMEFNIEVPEHRSNSVTTLIMSDGSDPQPIINFCREECGVVLGIGIGMLDAKAIRIAHMGHVNAPMILGTLGVVETALLALDITHGSSGVAAAAASLGAELASARDNHVGAQSRASMSVT